MIFHSGNLVTFKRGKKQFYEERKDFLDSEALTTFDENKVFDQKTKELVELDQLSYDFPLGTRTSRQAKKQFYEERKDVPDSKGYTAIVENKVSN
jgi:hypothetical protein